MVVSEFNPFESEKVMKNAYNDMVKSEFYKTFKKTFTQINNEDMGDAIFYIYYINGIAEVYSTW